MSDEITMNQQQRNGSLLWPTLGGAAVGTGVTFMTNVAKEKPVYTHEELVDEMNKQDKFSSSEKMKDVDEEIKKAADELQEKVKEAGKEWEANLAKYIEENGGKVEIDPKYEDAVKNAQQAYEAKKAEMVKAELARLNGKAPVSTTVTGTNESSIKKAWEHFGKKAVWAEYAETSAERILRREQLAKEVDSFVEAALSKYEFQGSEKEIEKARNTIRNELKATIYTYIEGYERALTPPDLPANIVEDIKQIKKYEKALSKAQESLDSSLTKVKSMVGLNENVFVEHLENIPEELKKNVRDPKREIKVIDVATFENKVASRAKVESKMLGTLESIKSSIEKATKEAQPSEFIEVKGEIAETYGVRTTGKRTIQFKIPNPKFSEVVLTPEQSKEIVRKLTAGMEKNEAEYFEKAIKELSANGFTMKSIEDTIAKTKTNIGTLENLAGQQGSFSRRVRFIRDYKAKLKEADAKLRTDVETTYGKGSKLTGNNVVVNSKGEKIKSNTHSVNKKGEWIFDSKKPRTPELPITRNAKAPEQSAMIEYTRELQTNTGEAPAKELSDEAMKAIDEALAKTEVGQNYQKAQDALEEAKNTARTVEGGKSKEELTREFVEKNKSKEETMKKFIEDSESKAKSLTEHGKIKGGRAALLITGLTAAGLSLGALFRKNDNQA